MNKRRQVAGTYFGPEITVVFSAEEELASCASEPESWEIDSATIKPEEIEILDNAVAPKLVKELDSFLWDDILALADYVEFEPTE